MAVYQGTRLRAPAVRGAAAPARPRTAPRSSGPSAARVRPIGLLLAAILAATMLGLVYLTQTLGSNATTSQVRALQAEIGRLDREERRQEARVQVLIDSEVIAERARELGLQKRRDIVVLEAP